jgi:uncharacterized membrane protein YjjB (DUF3815 family)
MMLSEWLIQVGAAYAGAVGFAMFFNVQPVRLFWAGLGGFLGWAVYLALESCFPSPVVRYFLAAVCFTLYSDPLARFTKTPTTVYLVPAAIPMVPGASLYRSMRYAVAGQWQEFSHQILYTLLLASAIAAGIVFGMTIIHVVRNVLGRLRNV